MLIGRPSSGRPGFAHPGPVHLAAPPGGSAASPCAPLRARASPIRARSRSAWRLRRVTLARPSSGHRASPIRVPCSSRLRLATPPLSPSAAPLRGTGLRPSGFRAPAASAWRLRRVTLCCPSSAPGFAHPAFALLAAPAWRLRRATRCCPSSGHRAPQREDWVPPSGAPSRPGGRERPQPELRGGSGWAAGQGPPTGQSEGCPPRQRRPPGLG